jgi:hypothetical protein
LISTASGRTEFQAIPKGAIILYGEKLALGYVIANFPSQFMIVTASVPQVLGIGLINESQKFQSEEVWSNQGLIYILDKTISDHEDILTTRMNAEHYRANILAATAESLPSYHE